MKRIAIVFMCLVCLLIGACLPIMADAEQNLPLKIWKHNDNGSFTTGCVIDEATGVNYIVVAGEINGHSHGFGAIAVTPRLNADGTLYVTD